MPRCPQPVPPIFQPEVAAQAIVRAAHIPRREWWVGWPAVKAILSSRLLPGLGDRIAARRAWSAQQGDEPAAGGRDGNLLQPVPGRQAAHGRFDARSRTRSWQAWASQHRAALAVAGALIAAGVWLASGRTRSGAAVPPL
jgi:hypothetical protein